jgi:hypothetical protein
MPPPPPPPPPQIRPTAQITERLPPYPVIAGDRPTHGEITRLHQYMHHLEKAQSVGAVDDATYSVWVVYTAAVVASAQPLDAVIPPEVPQWVRDLAVRFEGRFTRLENRFDGLENRFDGLENRFDGLENRFDGLFAEGGAGQQAIERALDLTHARVVNATAHDELTPLTPVPSRRTGELPPGDMFPATLGHFRRMTGPQLNALLAFYQLEAPRNVDERRRLLARYIGARP